jgi:hypothetical protein
MGRRYVRFKALCGEDSLPMQNYILARGRLRIHEYKLAAVTVDWSLYLP